MGGFKYQYHNPPPQAPNGAQDNYDPTNATRCDRPCRTVPLVDAQLLGVTVTPSTESKNSLRLAYYTEAQSLAICFPEYPQPGKLKISCPAHACEMFREGPILYIQMELAKCKFSDAEPHKIAQYLPSESVARMVSDHTMYHQESEGVLRIQARCVKNSAEENGSDARLAHQFAEHVLYASSSLPQKVPPSQYSATFVKARGSFGGRFGSRAARPGHGYGKPHGNNQSENNKAGGFKSWSTYIE
ncbi:hypothetical protein FN846DRAFT_956326 [Sphaerosporella brunnea]|uniref:Uncharacterized protein n=1 Tax=Sphaerosporella brunnea TaxID=1250544 RepID=A0A5J5ERS5_9PEZI|nr:hypothetical protein FN846DRAFT_956326 [Sphaerosporella brunnea]